MINFLMFSGVVLLFLAFPASVVVTIVFAIKKKRFLIPAICIPASFFAGMVVIMLGGFLYGQTDEYKQQLAEQTVKEQTEEEEAEEKEVEKKQAENKVKEQVEKEVTEKENTKKETKVEKEEPTEEKELTEQEYKSLCIEVYNDDVFKETVDNGTKVKIYVMASEKYDYSPTSMQGILVEKITKKYNLETSCLGCTVMHESTKNDAVPSYFGEQIYIMFQKDSTFNIDTFKTGQKLIIYGEIIQNTNGHYVLPKYYE